MKNQTPLPQLICVEDDATSLKAVERLLANDFEVLSYSSAEALEEDLDKYPAPAHECFRVLQLFSRIIACPEPQASIS